MKTLLLALTIFASGSSHSGEASRSPICSPDNIDEAKTLVYSNFIHTYTTKKYPFPYVYQATDLAFEKSITSDCRSNKASKSIIANATAACVSRCQQISKDFFTGFRKASKEEKLIAECSETCHQSQADLNQLITSGAQ